MSAIHPDKAYLEMRMNQYRNDGFIQYCMEAIRRILEKSQPHVKIDLETFLTEWDIDEPAKFNIAWWKMQIETHIITTYPELITNPHIKQ